MHLRISERVTRASLFGVMTAGLADALEREGVDRTHDVFVRPDEGQILVFAPSIQPVASMLARVRSEAVLARVMLQHHPERQAIEAAFELGGLDAVDLAW